jgi:DNA invertase Pin-like site-specific DNA recombinase
MELAAVTTSQEHLDRLARSTQELLTIEADLSKPGVGLIVLSMGGERLDTRNPTSKLMLTMRNPGQSSR